MKSSKTVIAMFPLLTVIFSVFANANAYPLIDQVQPIEPGDYVKSASLPVETFQVDFTVIGSDGLPSVGVTLGIFHNTLSMSSDPLETSDVTDSEGKVSFMLSRGSHVAIIINQGIRPQYLAIFRFYVREAISFKINVTNLTYPVILEAIKPLTDRPFTSDAYFIVRIMAYPNLMPFWFTEDNVDDQSCNATLLLPRNMGYSFGYEDDGARITMFVKNTQIRKPNTRVQFDASKTGFLKAVFTSPTGGFNFDMLVLYLEMDEPLPYTAALFIGDESSSPWAVTTGSYHIISSGVYSEEVDTTERFDYWFDFDVGRQNVRSKKLTNVVFGGDLKCSMKPGKKSYKDRDSVVIDYWFDDAYRHKVSWVAIHRYEYEDDNWVWKERLAPPMYLNIYDSEGLVESEDLDGYSIQGKMYLYAYTFGEPGSYTVELVLDSGPYHGDATGSTTVKIK